MADNRHILTIEANREEYSTKAIRETMTVGELMDYLSQFDEDTAVMISNDNGYTYGRISWGSFTSIEPDEEEEE